MEVRLEDFSSSDFDAKDWLNSQFASLSVDDVLAAPGTASGRRGGGEGFAQKLTTQLHFLATTSQQGNDRIKARFRHQAPQIARDIVSLGKLVQDTQLAIASFSKAVESQSLSAGAVERIVDIDTARRQLGKSVSSLEYLRNYANLPQKIRSLIADGDFVQAWSLVDKAKAMCSALGGQQLPSTDSAALNVLDAADIREYEEQVKQAAITKLCTAAIDGDAETIISAGHVLEDHGLAGVVEPNYIKQRIEVGSKRLRLAIADEDDEDISASLNFIIDAISQECGLIEAVGISDPEAALEKIVSAYFELLQGKIRRLLALDEQNDPSAASYLYQNLVAFYSDIHEALYSSQLRVGESSASRAAAKSDQLPQSLCLLFSPFRQFLETFTASEVGSIRNGSLEKLLQLPVDYAGFYSYAKDASFAIHQVFADIEQSLERVFEVVPASKIDSAISEIASLVSDVLAHFAGILATIASRYCIPNSGAAGCSDLAAFPRDDSTFTGDVYQPLSNEGKLETVSRVVELSLLGRLLSSCVSACMSSISERWTVLLAGLQQQSDASGNAMMPSPVKLLLSAHNEACLTLAEMDGVIANLTSSGLSNVLKISSAIDSLSQSLSSTVVFVLTSSFRPPLSRLPTLGVWQAVRANKSNMNIEVPQFSCSPSEEAVEIGEKMHVLLPDLEQVGMMDLQCTRDEDGLYGALPSIYEYVLESLDKGVSAGNSLETSTSAIQPMLCFVLGIVLKSTALQISLIQPPLSEDGRQQLVADVDYIASVASSFTSSIAPEFEVVRRMLVVNTDGNTGDGRGQEAGSADRNSRSASDATLQKINTRMRALLNRHLH